MKYRFRYECDTGLDDTSTEVTEVELSQDDLAKLDEVELNASVPRWLSKLIYDQVVRNNGWDPENVGGFIYGVYQIYGYEASDS